MAAKDIDRDDWGLEPLDSPESSNYPPIAYFCLPEAEPRSEDSTMKSPKSEEKLPDIPHMKAEKAMSANSTPQDTCAVKRKGRKLAKETIILKKFRKHKKIAGGYKAPKKEDLRMSLIRGFKRKITFAARHVQVYLLLFPSSILQKQIEFADFVQSHPELLSSAEPTAGPATDGKAYRDSLEDAYRSYNNHYCREFFANPSTREAYQLYLKLVFAEEDEKAWEENLGFQAVGEEAERLQAWEELRVYLTSELVVELLDTGGRC